MDNYDQGSVETMRSLSIEMTIYQSKKTPYFNMVKMEWTSSINTQ